MPLDCGANPFAGRLQRQADATDAVSAYDFAHKLVVEAVRQHVAAFVQTLQCPANQCAQLRYEPDALQTTVHRVWGGPSPDLPGHYRVVVEAQYRFEVACEAASPQPPLLEDQPPLPEGEPLPDTEVAPGRIPWWLERLLRIACLHYCAFKEAGSDFSYCHVHLTEAVLMPGGPGDRVTGVGHDDNTNNDHPFHTSVSRGGTCGFDPSGAVPALQPPDFGESHWMDIHFAPLAPGEEPPEGFFLFECGCGTMCYTFLRPAFDLWHDNLVRKRVGLPPLDLKLSEYIEKKWNERGGR